MASSSKITIENANTSAPKGLDFEEATAGDIITMLPTLVRKNSPSPDLRVIVFKPTSPVPSLLEELISVLFDHFNEFLISPTMPPLSLTFPGVTLLDSTTNPDFVSALGNDCHLKRTTLAFVTEICIYHPASYIIPITIDSITEPFEGELLFTPTHSELAMDSIIFYPHHYSFGVVVGFFTQSSDGHFLKVVLCFNTWREFAEQALHGRMGSSR